jgi:hypothetical protein
LRPLAKAFAVNVVRTSTFAFTPAEIAFRAKLSQVWLDSAIVKTTGKLEPGLLETLQEEAVEEIHKAVQAHADVFKTRSKEEINDLRDIAGVAFVEHMLATTRGMQVTMNALLSSVVIESWMAFETLTPSLWMAAVNHGPPEFAQRVNIAIQGKADSKTPEHWKDKLRHDPRKDYAASLIEVGTVSFRRLERIIYWLSVSVENNVRELFKEYRDIHALAAYRNVLIHNSGRVDKDFIKQIEPVPDLRGTFVENQELQLDGELVTRLRESAVALGTRLILFVDDLITPKPSSDADGDF